MPNMLDKIIDHQNDAETCRNLAFRIIIIIIIIIKQYSDGQVLSLRYVAHPSTRKRSTAKTWTNTSSF